MTEPRSLLTSGNGVSPARLAALFVAAAVLLPAVVLSNSQSRTFRALAFLLFAYCIVRGAKEHYALNPFYLFSLVPLSLLLYDHEFATYYLNELTPYTYLLVLYNAALFVAALSLVKFNRSGLFKGALPDKVSLVKAAYLLLVVGLLPVAYGIARAPGMFFSGDWLGMSSYVNLMPLSSVIQFCRYLALACAMKSRDRRCIAIVLLGCALGIAVQFNKTQLIFLMFTLLICLYKYYSGSKRSRFWLGVLTFAGLLVLLWSVLFYDGIRSDYDSTAWLAAHGADSSVPEPLMLPYMYLVSSWNNLQYVIQTQPDHTYGLWLIRPFLFFIHMDGPFEESYQLIASSNAYNTFSYVANCWKDFGFAGSGVVSFLLGLYISWIYSSFKQGDSPLLTAMYAINAVAVAEMFFSNHFFQQVYPFSIVVICIVIQLVLNGRGRARRETARLGCARREGTR